MFLEFKEKLLFGSLKISEKFSEYVTINFYQYYATKLPEKRFLFHLKKNLAVYKNRTPVKRRFTLNINKENILKMN